MALLDVDAWSVENWQLLVSCSRCAVANPTVASCRVVGHEIEDALFCKECADDYYEYYYEIGSSRW